MHFCIKCDNMYYLKVKESDANKLIYYCRHCGHESEDIDATDTCVLKTQVNRNEEKYMHVVNEYTKQDPTLPRIKTIKCPNQECPSTKGDKENEIIFIRYDDRNIRYIYMCAHCDTTWRTNDQQ